MIDIEKVREALKRIELTPFIYSDVIILSETSLFTEEFVDIDEALTELERLQKKEQQEQSIEKIFGFDINDIRLICVLINERFMGKDNFHEVLRNFQKAYQKGYDDCHNIMEKALNEQFKNLLRSDEK